MTYTFSTNHCSNSLHYYNMNVCKVKTNHSNSNHQKYLLVPASQLTSVKKNKILYLQPMRTAVAIVMTVPVASFRFKTLPDIWLRSSTAYLNMKGTITFISCNDIRTKHYKRLSITPSE